MKKLLLGLACFVGMSTAHASGIAIGTDAIKLLDQKKFNIIVQNALSTKSSLIFNLAVGDGTDLELGYKAYTTEMFTSVYYQFGGLINNLGNDNNDLGITGKIGYEHSPALHFIFYGNVTGTYMLDSNDIFYTPELGAMFSF
ncbi:hypothetical protein [Marinicellulosiphila megalodicopiae]|uniref:hypothetical protein n=1 Tax=Marinicellulosiphila megalodicopiae TaxID=2724896 RepID=UPI003BB1D9EF